MLPALAGKIRLGAGVFLPRLMPAPFYKEWNMFLFFGAIYVCGLIGMAGVTIHEVVEITRAAAEVIEKL